MRYWPGITTCGPDETKLKINEACLAVISYDQSTFKLQTQTSECHGCVFIERSIIKPNTTHFFVIDAFYPQTLKIVDDEQETLLTKHFDDFGLYALQYHEKRGLNLHVIDDPEYFWMNVSITVVIICLLAGCVKLWQFIQKRQWLSRLMNRNPPFEELDSEPTPEQVTEVRDRRLERLDSIDVFRGIAISLMIFVNYGGGQYAVFKHAPWNGLTVADVVFPFFIWIMGVSVVMGVRSQLRASVDKVQILKKAVTRSIFLICLGLMLNSGKHTTAGLRLPGVLQRIGLTYLIVAFVEILNGQPQRSELYGPWNWCAELIDSLRQCGVMLLFSVAHVVITFCLPVPGCPTGYLGPGGLSNDSDHPNCTGGAAGYIDRLIFSPAHLYQHPTSEKVYMSEVPYDPEGILGLLTSVPLAFLGALCGWIIQSHKENLSRIVRWLFWCLLLGGAAGCLCAFSKENGPIPINKNLWSLSYVLATASIAFLLFTVVYWLVDASHYWNGKPFLFAGMNSIAMYLGHEILNKQLPWRWTPMTDTHFEILIMDVWATIFWIVISYFMYVKKTFITL